MRRGEFVNIPNPPTGKGTGDSCVADIAYTKPFIVVWTSTVIDLLSQSKRSVCDGIERPWTTSSIHRPIFVYK